MNVQAANVRERSVFSRLAELILPQENAKNSSDPCRSSNATLQVAVPCKSRATEPNKLNTSTSAPSGWISHLIDSVLPSRLSLNSTTTDITHATTINPRYENSNDRSDFNANPIYTNSVAPSVEYSTATVPTPSLTYSYSIPVPYSGLAMDMPAAASTPPNGYFVNPIYTPYFPESAVAATVGPPPSTLPNPYPTPNAYPNQAPPMLSYTVPTYFYRNPSMTGYRSENEINFGLYYNY